MRKNKGFVLKGMMIVLFSSHLAYSGVAINTQSSIATEKKLTLKAIKAKKKEAKKAIDEYQKVIAMKLSLTVKRYWLGSSILLMAQKAHLENQSATHALQNAGTLYGNTLLMHK